MKRLRQNAWSFFILLVLIPANVRCTTDSPQDGLKYAVLMAESEIKHFPVIWHVDHNERENWTYTAGLISQAMITLWKVTGNAEFYRYAKSYADHFIDVNGQIKNYVPEKYDINCINSGNLLFELYHITADEKYRQAIQVLRDQFKNHPRTSEGGFWTKKVYTNQMWLDALSMGMPFYARYAEEFNQPGLFNDVIDQFTIIHRHTYDPLSGLNYHGWDESKEQRWADPETGVSPNFWGRAMGWYSMALVDVLDYIPSMHPGRGEIIQILKQVAVGIEKHQDGGSGLWFQVLDQGGREGNYLESTVSSMFVYSLLKGVRMGYLDDSYSKIARRAYEGILDRFIKNNEDGTVSLTDCCAVAGLGGNPYRDGSYEYYINEPIREDDPKGVGPFILASLEIHFQRK